MTSPHPGSPQQQLNNQVTAMLSKHAEPKHREFLARLVPTHTQDDFLGVRMPHIRRIARQLYATQQADPHQIAALLGAPGHRYVEEHLLNVLLINQQPDVHEMLCALEAYLPHIDNWMVCDAIKPSAALRPDDAAAHQAVEDFISRQFSSRETYRIRAGYVLLMGFYLGDYFRPEHLAWAAQADTQGNDYYTHTGCAWYFATALCKKPEATWEYMRGDHPHRLQTPTRIMALQKAIESRQMSDEDRRILRELRSKARTSLKHRA